MQRVVLGRGNWWNSLYLNAYKSFAYCELGSFFLIMETGMCVTWRERMNHIGVTLGVLPLTCLCSGWDPLKHYMHILSCESKLPWHERNRQTNKKRWCGDDLTFSHFPISVFSNFLPHFELIISPPLVINHASINNLFHLFTSDNVHPFPRSLAYNNISYIGADFFSKMLDLSYYISPSEGFCTQNIFGPGISTCNLNIGTQLKMQVSLLYIS